MPLDVFVEDILTTTTNLLLSMVGPTHTSSHFSMVRDTSVVNKLRLQSWQVRTVDIKNIKSVNRCSTDHIHSQSKTVAKMFSITISSVRDDSHCYLPLSWASLIINSLQNGIKCIKIMVSFVQWFWITNNLCYTNDYQRKTQTVCSSHEAVPDEVNFPSMNFDNWDSLYMLSILDVICSSITE